MKTCICDKCGKEIEIDVQEEVIDRDKDGKEISEQFFVCPECIRFLDRDCEWDRRDYGRDSLF